jgi:hypothetical protein
VTRNVAPIDLDVAHHVELGTGRRSSGSMTPRAPSGCDRDWARSSRLSLAVQLLAAAASGRGSSSRVRRGRRACSIRSSATLHREVARADLERELLPAQRSRHGCAGLGRTL